MKNSIKLTIYIYLVLFLISCSPIDTLSSIIFGSDDAFDYPYSYSSDIASKKGMLNSRKTAIKRINIPLPLTKEVKRELSYYLKKNPYFIKRSLARRERFYPMVMRTLYQMRMPYELVNLPIIESGYNPDAKSHKGAAGLWQFTKPTARAYGLRVNFFYDARYSPTKSTKAAIRHLKDLYNKYNSWYLALAAYNAGEGTVDRAIKKAGSRNFWIIVRKGYLPKQTRLYVPKFIAVSIIVSELEKGNTFAQIRNKFRV